MVPNAPCGVESKKPNVSIVIPLQVPNAPCGVERPTTPLEKKSTTSKVPNAPCGVESLVFLDLFLYDVMFLMHRVELKEGYSQS